MTAEQETIAMAFVETLAEYQIRLSVDDAHGVCCELPRWKSCMTWIATLEEFLSFGKLFKQPPTFLATFLTDDQRAGKAESFKPPKRVVRKTSLFD